MKTIEEIKEFTELLSRVDLSDIERSIALFIFINEPCTEEQIYSAFGTMDTAETKRIN